MMSSTQATTCPTKSAKSYSNHKSLCSVPVSRRGAITEGNASRGCNNVDVLDAKPPSRVLIKPAESPARMQCVLLSQTHLKCCLLLLVAIYARCRRCTRRGCLSIRVLQRPPPSRTLRSTSNVGLASSCAYPPPLCGGTVVLSPRGRCLSGALLPWRKGVERVSHWCSVTCFRLLLGVSL